VAIYSGGNVRRWLLLAFSQLLRIGLESGLVLLLELFIDASRVNRKT
jgi:hypothetical protein